MDADTKTFTRAEVATHNSETDLWVIIDSKVYDLTKFVKFHPGGMFVLTEVAGKDATKDFYDMHRMEILHKYDRFRVGYIAGEEKLVAKSPSAVQPHSLDNPPVPYADAPAWQGFKSPYFKETHFKYRRAVRAWMTENIAPIINQLDDTGKPPSIEIYKKMGEAGLLAARMGPGIALKMAPKGQLGGITPEEFDFFHEQIVHEEFARLGCPGAGDGLGAGLVIGLPPLLHFGKPEAVKKFAPLVLSGDKRICLAISEAFAGSDVAGIKTVARKSECGKFYIVNGTKKWITNGHFCDYFVTAVRTGKDGKDGVSLMLIERTEGVKTSLIHTSYSTSAGTAYVTFDEVKVPVENLLGEENKGFQCIMANFNHERWMICVGVIRANRLVVEDCLKWCMQRMVFGKPLIAQPVIREKLAHMIAQNEAVYSWLENITYQMCTMDYKTQTKMLGGPIALLKLQSTRVALAVSDSACQIFGGRSITKSGMGSNVEKFQRALKYSAILGGSEEIMADLGVKMAIKAMPKNAKL